MMEHYPQALCQRYQLPALPETGIELFDLVARRRGCMRRGGIGDSHKVAEILINDFREGHFGRISLETPAMVESEQATLLAAKEAAR